MAKLLLNADGKVLTSNDKVLKAPEGVNVMKTLLDGRKEAYYLFQKYTGTSVDDLISYTDTENVTNMENMFNSCYNLETIPLLNTSNVTKMTNMLRICRELKTVPPLNTSKVTGMEGMFYSCQKIETIPQLDTSKNTTMREMFSMCYKLKTIPQLDTSNVTSMRQTFYQCNVLETVPPLNTSKVTDINKIFYNCHKLQVIDITSMDKITSTSNSQEFAYGCSRLMKLIIRTMTVIPPLDTTSFSGCYHFNGTVGSISNPEGLKDGRIYVPDNMVESLKSATNWSAYADIIVPLSTLQEE